MATCSNCGAQLQGDERFCVKCGKDVMAKAVAVAPAAQPMMAAPGPYGMPGTYPVAVPLPMPAPKKSGAMKWVVIGLVVLVGGYYYVAKHQPVTQAQPGTNPAQPGQPGTNPAQPAGNPGQPGAAPAQPAGAPSQPGVNPQQPGSIPVLVQQQVFGGRWVATYGVVEVTNARWTNNSSVVIQSATLDCVQYAANGAALSQTTNKLNGPVRPGTFVTFGPFQMGRIVPYMMKVNCGIVNVNPAS